MSSQGGWPTYKPGTVESSFMHSLFVLLFACACFVCAWIVCAWIVCVWFVYAWFVCAFVCMSTVYLCVWLYNLFFSGCCTATKTQILIQSLRLVGNEGTQRFISKPNLDPPNSGLVMSISLDFIAFGEMSYLICGPVAVAT